jgi:hypothetical protein
MADDVSEVQQLRRKLEDAVRLLARYIEKHPELISSPDNLRLVRKCQELERHLDRLDSQTMDTA